MVRVASTDIRSMRNYLPSHTKWNGGGVRRWASSLYLAPLALGLLAACDTTPSKLRGEWEIEVRTAGNPRSNQQPRHVSGVVVFDPHIPCYCDESYQLPDSAVVGRAYLDFRRLLHSGHEQGLTFHRGFFADYGEETVAVVRGSSVDIIISPHLGGAHLQGRVIGNEIRGQWALRVETGLTGTFVMKRVSRTSTTDSALIRSRRSIREMKEGPTPGFLRGDSQSVVVDSEGVEPASPPSEH